MASHYSSVVRIPKVPSCWKGTTPPPGLCPGTQLVFPYENEKSLCKLKLNITSGVSPDTIQTNLGRPRARTVHGAGKELIEFFSSRTSWVF